MKQFKTWLGIRKEAGGGKCIGICPYCTGTMIEGHQYRMPSKDHIKPKSRFPGKGRTITVCSQCNFMKRDLTLSEFLLDLQVRNNQLQQAINANNERIVNVSYLIKIGLEQ